MKVLIATDGSAGAEEGAWFFAHLPHREHVQLTIVSVVPDYGVHGSVEVVEWVRAAIEAEKQAAQVAVDRVAAMFEGADVDLETVVAQGQISKVILEQAKSREVDLIVLGARGHSALERVLLGSVSDSVAVHAHCSVLVVRPTGLREREHETLRMCLAYDDSDASRAAIKELQQFEWRTNTTLHIVSVLQLPLSYTDIPFEFDLTEIRDKIREKAEELAEQLRPTVHDVQIHVLDAVHVGNALTQFAEDHKIDVMLLGDTGKNAWERFMMGSASRYVLRHCDSSVWIVRQRRS